MIPPIRAILFDLGETLVSGDQVLPGVPEALEALGALVALGLVSDWTTPRPDASAEEVAALVNQYLSALEGFGLRRFFEPVTEHVTLSTEVGARKPDRRIFVAALQRLGLGDDLRQAVFVTEVVEHVAAARSLGMTALRFGACGDVTDWITGVETLGTVVDRTLFDGVLRDSHAVAPAGEQLSPGQTHEASPDGSPTRKRFSSF